MAKSRVTTWPPRYLHRIFLEHPIVWYEVRYGGDIDACAPRPGPASTRFSKNKVESGLYYQFSIIVIQRNGYDSIFVFSLLSGYITLFILNLPALNSSLLRWRYVFAQPCNGHKRIQHFRVLSLSSIQLCVWTMARTD